MATNTSFSVDDSQLRDFDKRLSRVGKVFDKTTTGKILRVALKPTLAATQRLAPVGQTKKKSGLTYRSKSGKVKRDGTYDRGGATRRSARIRIVEGVGDETVRGLVGISKSRGKAGWRTHLITRVNAHRRIAIDFLGQAERETQNDVIQNFGRAAEEVVTKTILKG